MVWARKVYASRVFAPKPGYDNLAPSNFYSDPYARRISLLQIFICNIYFRIFILKIYIVVLKYLYYYFKTFDGYNISSLFCNS